MQALPMSEKVSFGGPGLAQGEALGIDPSVSFLKCLRPSVLQLN